MNSLVSYTFTHGFIQQLSSWGFTLVTNDLIKERGYIQYLIPFSQTLESATVGYPEFSCLEFREVHDEVTYLSNKKHKDFSPFFSSPLIETKNVDHPNSAQSIISLLDNNMEDCELKLFLKLRKKYPLWGVEIKSLTLSSFLSPSIPSQKFQWKNKTAVLLHLGPSSLDLLITE